MTTHHRPRSAAASETQPINLRPGKGRKAIADHRTPAPPRKPAPRKKESGFTLLEIMLVVSIIALLLGAAIYNMGGNLGLAQETRVQTDIQAISTQLKIYQATNGFYPSSEQNLDALVTRPTTAPVPKNWRMQFEKLPVDPWGNPYIYEVPGKKNPNSFDLYSAGPDTKNGTEDDIGNWDK